MIWQTAGCCGGGDAEVTQVAIDDRGFTVGLEGQYKAALLQEYAAFCALKETSFHNQQFTEV